jgi:hypothetical protein
MLNFSLLVLNLLHMGHDMSCPYNARAPVRVWHCQTRFD